MKRYHETLLHLCKSGLVTPGSGVISLRIPNNEKTILADFDEFGHIILGERRWTTPSGFSHHFMNRRDNGWKSVRYNGTTLDELRIKYREIVHNVVQVGTDDDPVGIPAEFMLSHPMTQEMLNRETQGDCYRNQGACEEVVQLADMNCKSYGKMENIVRDYFGISKTKTTENDGMKGELKIEIKCPRLQTNGRWMIQHLKPGHDFDAVLIALLTPKYGLHTMVISKSDVFKVAKPQKGEGWLVSNTDLVKRAIQVRKGDDLTRVLLREDPL